MFEQRDRVHNWKKKTLPTIYLTKGYYTQRTRKSQSQIKQITQVIIGYRIKQGSLNRLTNGLQNCKKDIQYY